MKTIKHTLLIASLFIGLTASAQKLASSQFVSIIPTSSATTHTIDTVIDGGQESLELLLTSQGLSIEEVHLMRISDFMSEMTEGGEHAEIIMVHTEDISDGEQEPHTIKMIRVNGEDTDLESLSEEERAMIKEGRMHMWSPEGDAASNGEVHTIRVRKELEGDGEPMEIQIEKSVENGETHQVILVNGEEKSQEELDALMQEHHVEISTDISTDKKMVFIGEGAVQQFDAIHKKEIHTVVSSDMEKKALVIVRPEEKKHQAVSAMSLSPQFNLYPNPANDKVSLRFEEALNGRYSIQVTSLEGGVVRQLNGNAKKKSLMDLDVSDLAPGTYVVTVGLESGMMSSKLIIE
ncbi:MAG: T9SS type A sorting domain-containing protein [Flavobacteriales bacterium]|nr:T9SS type A sorting domain-containing protein [Flavobacteriales bacterium]